MKIERGSKLLTEKWNSTFFRMRPRQINSASVLNSTGILRNHKAYICLVPKIKMNIKLLKFSAYVAKQQCAHTMLMLQALRAFGMTLAVVCEVKTVFILRDFMSLSFIFLQVCINVFHLLICAITRD